VIIPIISEQERIEFWTRVQQPQEGCWLWSESRFKSGYGSFRYEGRSYYTHVIAFYLSVGVWPGDRLVMHTCDNPPCCRPEHLIDGTNLDNSIDCIRKGRGNRGNGNHTFITKEDADEIRRLRLFDISAKEIANMPRFKGKIGIDGIYHISKGNTWKPKS
jgi:hypothetical protein